MHFFILSSWSQWSICEHTCSLWHYICVQLQDNRGQTKSWMTSPAHAGVQWYTLQVRLGVRDRLKLTSLATSTIILPRGSLSASMSKNTTGFLVGPEENSFAAAIPGELYLMRFLIWNIAARLTQGGRPAGGHAWRHTDPLSDSDTTWEVSEVSLLKLYVRTCS